MFLVPSVTLPIIRNGCIEQVTVRKWDVLSIAEYDEGTCHVRIPKDVVPKYCDEHLRVNLSHDVVRKMVQRRW